jgi:hypothetical protein
MILTILTFASLFFFLPTDIPAGWWHTVINLEESLAITQNFVCANNLADGNESE